MDGRNKDDFRRALTEILPRLRREARWRTRRYRNPIETADEAVQEACTHALAHASEWTGKNIASWLLTILDRVLVDEVRRRQRRPLARESDVDKLDQQPDPRASAIQRGVIAAEELELLREDLLPEQWRTARLVYYWGHSYEEAAAVLDIPVGTIKSRLYAVRRLAEGKPK
ncbi:MAG: sigma-70 family RNA polymerase sigma factor [Rhizobiales bacterium]|nr:sigma-70 family RNA polymerase sigma factor [Hyphomicrobiales bacterium]